MALYSDQTPENILARSLARVDVKYDKRTGSIIFNTHAPNAEELALVYQAIDDALDGVAMPDTARREFLIRHCAARGIAPYAATGAIVIGRFTPADIELAVGTRFNCGLYYYAITERITDPASVIDDPDTATYSYYYLECETEGEAPNGTTGRLIPAESIIGLKSGEIIEVAIYGNDEEDTEALRRRFYDSIGAEAFGGNQADYKSKILAMQGVGGVKIYPAWNGGGTVRLVVSATGNTVPSLTLVENIQVAVDPIVIDPDDQWGHGFGLAPIGHHVTVNGAGVETINISTTLVLESGFVLNDVIGNIEAALDAYYAELNATWMYTDYLSVRISEINARILSIDHVVDIYDTTLNGLAANVIVNADSLVTRGSFEV